MTKMNCNQNKYVNKWNYTLSHNDTAILSKFSINQNIVSWWFVKLSNDSAEKWGQVQAPLQ